MVSVLIASAVLVAPTSTAYTLLCQGKTVKEVAACDTSGYAAVMNTSHWRMYPGHNCTNYAAWRMKLAGVPEPEILMGNARDWPANAASLGYVVNTTAAVGAIAVWSSASHLGYVEEVAADHLVISDDSYGSKVFKRTTLLPTDSWYPDLFIHFKDVGQAGGPAKVKPRVKVSKPTSVSRKKRAKITVAVLGDGRSATGKISIYRGTKRLKTSRITATKHGKITVTLPRLKPGTHSLRAVYSGNAVLTRSTSRTVKLKVR